MVAIRIAKALPLAVVLAVALVLPRGAAAQDPRALVAYVGAQGMAAAAPEVPPAQQIARLRQLYRDYFDVPGLAAFTLGRYRAIASSPQQQEFLRLYEDYTVELYGAQLARYGGLPFRVTGSRSYGAQVVVGSEIVRPDGGPVQIDWHLAQHHGRYLITDVVIGGMSMRTRQRHDFAEWIQANGGRFDALLAVLRQQIAQAQ
jgi:phospholipid transport system substrate-binding protein